jgi:hypothetical protein
MRGESSGVPIDPGSSRSGEKHPPGRERHRWKRGAGLTYANLSNAYLGGADLEGANVDGEQLAMCKSLEGATMPDRSKHD